VSFDPFGRSDDLARLASEGYELELTQAGHLLVKHVPYRTEAGVVDYGTIISPIEMNGDITVSPVGDHSTWFSGTPPFTTSSGQLVGVIDANPQTVAPGLTAGCRLSCKRGDQTPYPDYYEKITTYVGLIGAAAHALDRDATAITYGPCLVENTDWPFEYVDTAPARAGIGAVSGKLTGSKIAIVGLGGTGSYILDLVAKCPVAELHLYDGDVFSTHNAFRAPGAPTLDQLRAGQAKVDYLARIYSNMKRNVVAHPYPLTAANADELQEMSFVFLAMEGGETKRDLVAALEAAQLPFVDVSLGVVRAAGNDLLLASLEVNGSTAENRQTVHDHVDFGTLDEDDPYEANIQIAELNAMNAAFAVLWWKKHAGIYHHKTLHHHERLNVGFSRLVVR
jgi:ThiF family